MREIKFRAWDKVLYDTVKRSRMFEVYGLNISTNYVSAYKETGDEVVHDLRDCILMQFTGLKDKNGKEIYESDYIKTPAGFGLVIWDKCYWIQWEGGGRTTLWDTPEQKMEVIGNEFEN